MPNVSAERPRAALAGDIGGTFTDIVLERGRQRWSKKLLTTHGAPEDALFQGIAEVLEESRTATGEIGWFVHGMTLATNAILERRGACTALLTTEGFRDVLEIGYEGRYDPFDLRLVKPAPLVARERRHVVAERHSAAGEVLVPLDEARLRAVTAKLEADGIESLAIGFLHAHVNSAHERRARDVISALMPSLSISLSSEICPEIREYERISTVVANAYIQPLVTTYLDRLAARLAAIGITCPAFLMTSGGGVMPLEIAKRVPIRLVESGPAGGAVFAASIASELSEREILSFDMGGTTAKICFIADATPQLTRLFEVDRAARFRKGSGFPVRIPAVELVEIGAGGGSIASVDFMGRIAVGPQSAGSEPGPACYGRNGEQPTVTDADLLLGKIDPARFAGGKMHLDAARSRDVFESELGARLGMDAVEAAFGTVELVDETMANAARVHAAELGRDLARHTMVAFGGAAPLHAARLAEKLGIARIVVPRSAGVGSALGFLRAPVGIALVASRPMRLDAYDGAVAAEVLRSLRERAGHVIDALPDVEGLAVTRAVDMRYVGQGHELTVPLERELPDAAELARAFAARYATLYGRVIPGAPIEVLSWQVRIASPRRAPAPNGSAEEDRAAALPVRGVLREVFDPQAAAFGSYEIFERNALSPGDRVSGPALIVEDETTTVVTGAFHAFVGAEGHLVLERQAGGHA